MSRGGEALDEIRVVITGLEDLFGLSLFLRVCTTILLMVIWSLPKGTGGSRYGVENYMCQGLEG